MGGRVILVRHGNTFGPEDPVVWAGAREDYPLVEKGRRQADALGRALATCGRTLSGAVAGPLLRTRQTASAILALAAPNLAASIDDRLREIDYGPWGGLSNEAIDARFGVEVRRGWNERSAWPEQWADTEAAFRDRALGVLSDVLARSRSGDELVVTSNGVLRMMRAAIDGERGAAAKVATGHACVITADEAGAPRLQAWNIDADALAEIG